MPQFNDHIRQADRNLRFLKEINNSISDCMDWQVTVCFYIAVHYVNAHLAQVGLQYRKHKDVNDAISPYNRASVTKVPEDVFVAYMKLQKLSRRSRYLVNQEDNQLHSTQAALTYYKHLLKAIRNLDVVSAYFCGHYKLYPTPVPIKCEGLKKGEKLVLFEVM